MFLFFKDTSDINKIKNIDITANNIMDLPDI